MIDKAENDSFGNKQQKMCITTECLRVTVSVKLLLMIHM